MNRKIQDFAPLTLIWRYSPPPSAYLPGSFFEDTKAADSLLIWRGMLAETKSYLRLYLQINTGYLQSPAKDGEGNTILQINLDKGFVNYGEGARRGLWRRGGDSNPRNALTFVGFQDRCIRPLCHLSIALFLTFRNASFNRLEHAWSKNTGIQARGNNHSEIMTLIGK